MPPRMDIEVWDEVFKFSPSLKHICNVLCFSSMNQKHQYSITNTSRPGQKPTSCLWMNTSRPLFDTSFIEKRVEKSCAMMRNYISIATSNSLKGLWKTDDPTAFIVPLRPLIARSIADLIEYRKSSVLQYPWYWPSLLTEVRFTQMLLISLWKGIFFRHIKKCSITLLYVKVSIPLLM